MVHSFLRRFLLFLVFSTHQCIAQVASNDAGATDDSDNGPPCRDLRDNCQQRANTCQTDALWMQIHCPVTCGTCWKLEKRAVPVTEAFGYNVLVADKIVNAVGRSIGVPQHVEPNLELAIRQRVQRAQTYINSVLVNDDLSKVWGLCRNLNSKCAAWAVQGECDINEQFMTSQCAPVCETCEYLHVETMCPIDPNERSGR